jgi:hypothetical protein
MQHFTGMDYLKMDIASNYGLDKKTWQERLDWFDQNKHQLDSLVATAAEPAQFFAAVQAYNKSIKGMPSGYPCSLDATASGLQILSLLSGCKQSARLCNLINTGKREDAYTTVTNTLFQRMGGAHNVTYKQSKQALMTHLYGSVRVPEEVFGKDTPFLEAFYLTVDQLLPGANGLNYLLINLWDPQVHAHCWTLPDGFDVVIKSMGTVEHPVTFCGQTIVVPEKVNMPLPKGLSLGANIVHSIDGMVVREMNRRCNYDKDTFLWAKAILEGQVNKLGASTERTKDLALLRVLALYDMTGFMSLVVLEHLDTFNAAHLTDVHKQALQNVMQSVPAAPFSLLTVHDCFRFHPNQGNNVRKQYRNILAELADSNILSAIISELRGIHTPITKLSTDLGDDIRQSEYAIC